MRRTVLLFSSALLAAWAVHLALGQTGSAPYYVRDGLLIAIIATLIFAWRSSPPRDIRPTGVTYLWPFIGRALWGTGLASTLAASLIFVLFDSSTFVDSLSVTSWWLGLALMPVGAFWRGPVRDFSAPSFRWERNANGELVRVDVAGSPVSSAPASGYLSGIAIFVGVIIVLALGAFLRLWQLSSAPSTCVGQECAAALALISDAQSSLGIGVPAPATALAGLLLRFVDDPVLCLRMSAAIFGIATLVTLFLALRKLIIADSALLGTWLMALSPWHIALSRTGGSSSATIFAVTISLWATLQALGNRDRRWWIVAGMMWGLIALIAPGLTMAVWLWAGVIVFIACVIHRRVFVPSLLALTMTLAVSLPVFFANGSASTFANITIPASEMIGSVMGTMSLDAGLSVQNWLYLTLAVLGIGYLLRYAIRPGTAVVLSGLIAFALGGFLPSESAALPVSPGVALLPIGVVAATLAGDQLLRALVDPWRKVVRPAYFVAAAIVMLALIGARGLGDLQDQAMANVSDPAQPAMMDYLVERLAGDSDLDAVIYVPPDLVENPAIQLQGADWLAKGQVRPMTSIEDVLFGAETNGDLSFLVSGVDATLLDLLTAFFPTSTVEPHFDQTNRQLLFHSMAVSPQDRAWPGLAGVYRADADSPEVLLDRRENSLDFGWQSVGPEPPFVATWQGTLYVPAAGRYTFSTAGLDGDKEDVTVLLDNEIVLASELNVLEQEKSLSQGFYPINVRYNSGENPTGLTIFWTHPDGVTEPISQTNLTARTLPNIGLEGVYFANETFQPPALLLRRDLRFDQPLDEVDASSVRWAGKVAANRAGEYLFALVDEGDSWLRVNERLLVDNPADADDSATPGYVEGVIYLEPGWHDIEIGYAPDESPSSLKVLWQPPGSHATALSARYLSPERGKLGPLDLPLPGPPALIETAIGDDDFALSQHIELRRSSSNMLPASLHPLPLTLVWQAAGGCGSGEGQLAWPHGVAFDASNKQLLVADSGNRRVAIFEMDGRWKGAITSNTFEEPHDIDVSADGRISVLDAVGSPIQRIEPVNQTVEPVTIDTGFYRPRGLSASMAGVLAVADTGGGRVVLLTQDGAILAEYGSPDSAFGRGQPVDVALSSLALWSITAEDGRLWDLNTDGSLAVVQPTTTLDGPQLAVLADDTVVVTDPEGNRLLYFRDDGRPLAEFSFSGVLNRPTGVDVTLLLGEPHIAVVDTDQCSLSLWRMGALQ